MTMPYGSTEEPDVIETEKTSIPVRVVSTDAKPGKAIAPEFGRWRTFLVTSALGNDLAVPGARRIANRSLRRHRIHIIINSSVTPVGSSPVTAASTFAAAASSTATLAAGASITGFDITVGQAASANTVPVTVTGATGGTLTYTMTIEGTGVAAPVLSIRFPQPLTPANPAVGIAVTFTGNANSPAGDINVFGLTAATGTQPLTDGVIVGGREEIAALVTGGGSQPQNNPLNGYTPGGYLQIGDNVRYESQQELWVAYPASNSAPVLVSTCDEVYASDPDAWKGDQ